MRYAIMLALCAPLAACDEAKPPNPRDAVIDAWKKGGLEVSAFAAATAAFAKDCQSGTVRGVEVMLCTFPTPAEAKAAEDPGLAWVGDATGVSQSRGAVLIVAADRKKQDLNGRTLNQLTKLAPAK